MFDMKLKFNSQKYIKICRFIQILYIPLRRRLFSIVSRIFRVQLFNLIDPYTDWIESNLTNHEIARVCFSIPLKIAS